MANDTGTQGFIVSCQTSPGQWQPLAVQRPWRDEKKVHAVTHTGARVLRNLQKWRTVAIRMIAGGAKNAVP